MDDELESMAYCSIHGYFYSGFASCPGCTNPFPSAMDVLRDHPGANPKGGLTPQAYKAKYGRLGTGTAEYEFSDKNDLIT